VLSGKAELNSGVLTVWIITSLERRLQMENRLMRVSQSPIKEFYFNDHDGNKLYERQYTAYEKEIKPATQTSPPLFIRVKHVHYDKPVENFPTVGVPNPTK
jgi:hypothetical protein